MQSRELLYTPYAASKSTDSVTRSINFSFTSVWKSINRMQSLWNSTVITCIRKRLKPGPYFSSSFSGLGTRLGETAEVVMVHFLNMTSLYQTRKHAGNAGLGHAVSMGI